MDTADRDRFDRTLEQVLGMMPPLVHQLLEKIPLHVEDYPSARVLRATDTEAPAELCGLFTGVPLGDRSVLAPGELPDVVTIYREGILAAAADARGRVRPKDLKEQIRITILHELAHYHGLSEEELARLGYQ
jgi:predicted Zn-dependent protease with MMP-like domain